jgi:hypothetical protein
MYRFILRRGIIQKYSDDLQFVKNFEVFKKSDALLTTRMLVLSGIVWIQKDCGRKIFLPA